MCNEEKAFVTNDEVVNALLNAGFTLDREDDGNTYFSRGVLSAVYTVPSEDDERVVHRISVETSTGDLEDWEIASRSMYFNQHDGLESAIVSINKMR